MTNLRQRFDPRIQLSGFLLCTARSIFLPFFLKGFGQIVVGLCICRVELHCSLKCFNGFVELAFLQFGEPGVRSKHCCLLVRLDFIESSSFLKFRSSRLDVSRLSQGVAECVMYLRSIRCLNESLAESRHGAGEIALLLHDGTQSKLRLRVIRLYFYRSF